VIGGGSLEYSPPITNTRPSRNMPDAKNWRALLIAIVDDQDGFA
jgi:hypothetical protein